MTGIETEDELKTNIKKLSEKFSKATLKEALKESIRGLSKEVSSDIIQETLQELIIEMKEHKQLPKPPNSPTKTLKPAAPVYTNIVLSGGSVKGLSHFGAIHRLVETGHLDLSKIKCYTCVSAGAMCAFFFVLGFSFEQIWDFAAKIDFKKLISPDFSNIKKCGVDTGDKMQNLFEEILSKRTGIRDCTLLQLFNITKIKYNIVGSCLTTKEEVYFNYETYPDMKVSTAIRISMSIPFILIPVTFAGKKYIDGGILNNYPINQHSHDLDKTIGFLVCDGYDTDYQYAEQFPMAILNLYLHNYNKELYRYRKNTVYIKGGIDKFSSFSFNITNIHKERMFLIGVESADSFISSLKNDIT